MANQPAKILIVDDEPDICEFLSDELSLEGYVCFTAANGTVAKNQMKSRNFDIILLDLRLPDISGINILEDVKALYSKTRVIMMTGIDDIETAIEVMKCGASDYIVKPFSVDRINGSIISILQQNVVQTRNVRRTFSSHANSNSGNPLPNGERFHEMNAIASGVRARNELRSGYSKKITKETAAIAFRLGIDASTIRSWVQEHDRSMETNNRSVERSLGKLKRNLPAQEIMGLVRPYMYSGINDGRSFESIREHDRTYDP